MECSEKDNYQLILKPLTPGLKVVRAWSTVTDATLCRFKSIIFLMSNVFQVDLVKHHGVLVTKAGLSRILLSGGDDPRALVRAALLELYGKEELKKMSGTKSLQKHVLDAIQSNYLLLF